MKVCIAALWYFLVSHAAWFLAAGLSTSTLYHVLRWRKDNQRSVWLELPRREIHPAENLPLVSILVPAWNEANNVEVCIRSIFALRYPNKELILCAGGKDGTYAIASSLASTRGVVLEQKPGEGKQRALQRCFQNSHGKVIFLTDADCILEDQVFESTLYPILVEGKPVTTGTWKPFHRSIQNPLVQYQWSHHLYREAWLPDHPSTLDGRNAAIRREVVESAEPFAAQAPTGTDYVQSKQLTAHGYTIFLARGSRVQTEYPETVRAYWQQLSRWFRTSLIMGKRWNDTVMVRSALWSGISSIGILLSIPALFIRPLLVLWLAVVFHLALAQLRTSTLARKTQGQSAQPRANFSLLQVYLPVGWIGLALGLIDSLLPRRRQNW